MCWSGEASAALAVVGLGTTVYVAVKGERKELWLPLGYFSLMEALQAYTYTVIDDCESPANQVATLLGYLHITFQPFFINLACLYFIPERISKKISVWVFLVCFFCCICFLIRLYPFEWAVACIEGITPFCGTSLCSTSGNWHIAWQAPLVHPVSNPTTFYGLGFLGYTVPAFILPLLYGNWRLVTYHFLLVSVAWVTTSSLNEWAAVWCLYAIGFLIVLIKTPVRKWMVHEKFYFWDYPGQHQREEDVTSEKAP